VLVEEVDHPRVGLDAVLQLRDAVALVLEDELLDRDVLAGLLGDLLGLPDGDARVVRAVEDEQRRGDGLDVVDGADGLEELAVLRQRAVLGLTEFAAPGAGVLQERDEVGDADYVDAGGPEVGILRERGEDHEAAVGAAERGDAAGVDGGVVVEPLDAGAEVPHRVHPVADVVGAGVLLPVAGGAPDVGLEDGVATGDEVLAQRVERGPALALGAAVDVDDDGDLAGALVGVGGEGEEAGDLQPVEALEVDQVAVAEALPGDAGGVRGSPAPALARVGVEDVDVGVGRRAGDGHGEAVGVVVEADAAGDRAGEFRRRPLLDGGRARQVADGQLGVAVDVPGVDQPPRLVVQRDAVDVPVLVHDQTLGLERLQVQPRQVQRVMTVVGDEVERVAVRAEVRAAVAHVALVRGEMPEVAARQVERVEVLVEVRVRLAHQQPVVVGRPTADGEPAVALVVQRRLGTGLVAPLRVDVEDGLVAPVRGEREPVAVVAPATPPVFGLRMSRQVGHDAGLVVEQVELEPLVAALVHPEDEFGPLGGPRHERHRLVVERPLLGPATGLVHRPHLRRPGGIHQEGEPSVGRQRRVVGTPDVQVPLQVVLVHGYAQGRAPHSVWCPRRAPRRRVGRVGVSPDCAVNARTDTDTRQRSQVRSVRTRIHLQDVLRGPGEHDGVGRRSRPSQRAANRRRRTGRHGAAACDGGGPRRHGRHRGRTDGRRG
jgi:hypothetical protein